LPIISLLLIISSFKEGDLKKVIKPKISTAYHEAGHAVASWHFRKRFRSVTIVPTGESLGCVKSNQYLKRNPEYELDSRMINCFETKAQILFAGYYAEKKFTGRGNSVGASRDFNTALSLLLRIHEGEVGRCYIRYILACTKNLWTYDDGSDTFMWPIVVGLANELMKVHTMKGKTAWEFITYFPMKQRGLPAVSFGQLSTRSIKA
jgi:hypothetical protein